MEIMFTDGRVTYTTRDLVLIAIKAVACESEKSEENEETVVNLLGAFARLLDTLAKRGIIIREDILEVLNYPYNITVHDEDEA